MAIMSVICGAAKPGIVATVFVMPISTPAYLPAAQNASSAATNKQMPREEETGGPDLGAMSRWLTLKPERLKPLAPTHAGAAILDAAVQQLLAGVFGASQVGRPPPLVV